MTSFDPHQEKEDARIQSSDATRRHDADPASASQRPNQTHAMRSNSAEVRPVMLGRYEIVEELGAGQMGTVYRGRDKVLEREVAIKVPKLENSDVRTLMVRRFYREARAVARLNHSSICPIYDVGEIDGQVFIAMGFIRGTTLDRLVGNGRCLRPRSAAKLIHRACMAMQHAHDHHVVHRDIKTSNMMIDSDGQPVLLDFGLAMLRDDKDAGISHDGQILGSPAYMSPEQVNGLGVDHRADIFSMGVVFYEALTGHRPFKGTFTQVLMGIAQGLCEAPHVLNPEVPRELSELCQRMMATSPELRFQKMKEVAEALAKYLAGTAAGAVENALGTASVAHTQIRKTTNVNKDSLSAVPDELDGPPSRSKSLRDPVASPRKRRKNQSSEGRALEDTQSAADPSVRSLWRRATEAVQPRPWRQSATKQSRFQTRTPWWIVTIILAVASSVAITLVVHQGSPQVTPPINSQNVVPTDPKGTTPGKSETTFSLDELDTPP